MDRILQLEILIAQRPMEVETAPSPAMEPARLPEPAKDIQADRAVTIPPTAKVGALFLKTSPNR